MSDFADIDALIESNQPALAASRMRCLWRERPVLGLANFVRGRCLRLASHFPILERKRLAILRGFTVEPLVPLLRTEALIWGLDLEVWIGGFDTCHSELRDASSALNAFQPDLVLLWIPAPEALRDDPADSGMQDRFVGSLRDSLRAFRGRNPAPLLAHDFDSQTAEGQAAWVSELNSRLARLHDAIPGFHVFPYHQLVARHGRSQWVDHARWEQGGPPVRSSMHIELAREWLKYLMPLSGRQGKVVVTDLDNTLWQGVAGEEEPAILRPYTDLQLKLKELRCQGFLLAICSKNNWEDVAPMLDGHPDMVLTRSDFAAIRVNWADKTTNLLGIAAELNVGVDSLLLVDDSPREREQVRQGLPAAGVIDLPASPSLYRHALEQAPTLHRLEMTDEDEARSQLYRDEENRKDWSARIGSLGDYLHSLDLRVCAERAGPRASLRAAQLTQRTNQFNLTTRRRTQAEILERACDPEWVVRIYRASDRFGDYGYVGLAMARKAAGELRIDTFLLSCRAMSRGIETAMLCSLIEESAVKRVACHYLPTAKNAPCADFLARSGFARDPEDATRWILDLPSDSLTAPPWIQLASSPAPSPKDAQPAGISKPPRVVFGTLS
jgi:FkbH-like protein